jgi:hypothetical protein
MIMEQASSAREGQRYSIRKNEMIKNGRLRWLTRGTARKLSKS